MCSKECRNKYLSDLFYGENSVLYNQFSINCDWCSKEFNITPSDYKFSENHFCCKDCQNEWYRHVFSQNPKRKIQQSIQSVKNLENGLIPKTLTKIHKEISNMLINNNINIKNEKGFEFYSVDVFLLDYNLVIEIMGRYWHCDSRKYKTINYKSQVDSIYRDKSKNTYFNNKNINILYLWEDDINNNLSLCSKLIELYIISEGKLKNYHSFNYNLIDNNITLKNNLIKPYMEYNNDELNSIIDLSVKKQRSHKQPEKWITFNCDYCGKEKETMLIHYNRCKNHFCSTECKAKFENTSIIINCDNCGKEHLVEQKKYKNNKKFFCCKECYNEFIRKEMIECNCDNCGELFLQNKNIFYKNKQNFCSRECYLSQIGNKVTYNCDYCGKEKTVKSSVYNSSQHNHFCSKSCAMNYRNKNINNINI